MKAPAALLERLEQIPVMATGKRRLVVLLTQLGDFDSMEYAQALAPELPKLECPVVIPQRRCFPQDPAPALRSGLQPTSSVSQAIKGRI